MKLWWYKISNWEYWPAKLVYTPTLFIWIWLSIKFRTIYFFKLANPSIKNGGLYGDSKAKIYKLLPESLYPKTVLIDLKQINNFQKIIEKSLLNFPLIVKPDIGFRGIAVQKVHSLDELNYYNGTATENFLIQETIEYPNEIGLFYCRLPGQNKGEITGITLKEFLTIEGNGNDDIGQLLKNNPRYEMQISKLRKQINLSEILPKGIKSCLVPFGNHNRGTKFLDGKIHITMKLQETFDDLLSHIDGFYYGRLDIRYNSFEELENGLNFSIIEINGAKAEPTHIYDPKHSFWYGQREIIRHQMIFQQIIKLLSHQISKPIIVKEYHNSPML